MENTAVGLTKRYLCCSSKGTPSCNNDYWKPHGILKVIQLVAGVSFAAVIIPECLQGHCYRTSDDDDGTKSDLLLRIFLIFAVIFCLIGTALLLLLHLICPEEQLKRQRFRCAEISFAVSAPALYFAVRYYCANYYGGMHALEGRWITATVLSWTLVVLYIVEAFVTFGVSIRCGGNLQRYHETPRLTLAQCV